MTKSTTSLPQTLAIEASTAYSSSAASIVAVVPPPAAIAWSSRPAVRYIRLSRAYSRAVISPSLWRMAPKVAIATPNWRREAAYFAASAIVARAPPAVIARA